MTLRNKTKFRNIGMSFMMSMSELEKLFPLSFFVRPDGSIALMSKSLQNATKAISGKPHFDQLLTHHQDSSFRFDFNFFKSNLEKDFTFVALWDQKEYRFTVVSLETEEGLFFAARNLFHALKEAEKLTDFYKSLASFPEENPNPTLRLDFKGNILFANRATRTTFSNFTALLENNMEFKAEFAKVVALKCSSSIELNLQGYVMHINFLYLDQQEYVNIYFRDITQERKNYNLAQAEKAQKIMASRLSSLGEMAAGIGHEINNPLTIISGRLEILKKLVGSPDFISNKESIVKSIETIQRSSQRISVIIKGLRNFARNGEQDPLQNVKLDEIIEDIKSLISEKLKVSGVSLKFDIALGLEINCRRVQIEQVIINLLNNSVDALSENQNKWIQLKAFEESDMVIIEVMDSGLGIEKQLRDKLMQPFFTTKEVGKGTWSGPSLVES